MNDLSILILSNGKHRQLTERRVPGAEIVERDRNAEILEQCQRMEALGRRLKQRGFGDFKFQTFWRKARLGERAHHNIR